MLAHDDELQSLFMNITNLDTPSIYDYEMCLRLMFFVCVYLCIQKTIYTTYAKSTTVKYFYDLS